jgi:hypothetical protein
MALLQKAYLGATPLFRNEDWFENDARLLVSASGVLSSPAVTITADTSAHTKGAWTQLVASTSSDASMLVCVAASIGSTSVDTASLIDIGFGASGSETGVASNIAVGGAGTAAGALRIGALFAIPLQIPSGTRISARLQSVVTGGKTAAFQAYVIDTGDYATAPTSVDVIGTSTATSKGTEFSGSSGTWNEVIASTAQAYRAVGIVISTHSTNTNSVGGIREYSVGIGASGSEVAFGTIRHEVGTAENASLMPPYSQLFGRNIPAGSRLAVQHNIAATPETVGVTLIGIP